MSAIPGVDEYAAGMSRFVQPSATKRRTTPAVPMTPVGLEISHRLKEMFHGYTNRLDRSQQETLGPSEIGAPCDRRLAMSLLRLPRVNPGGDNWASFVGTCGHAGLAEMLVWADAGSGRYVSETSVQLPSTRVPFGTADALDRQLNTVWDFKLMGQWSMDKLKTEGPSPQYRVQLHTYGYGFRIKGEVVSHVALVALPRERSSLDGMYVWTEPYDPQVARDALARVDRIGKQIEVELERDNFSDYADFPIDNSDCKYCPYYMPGAKDSIGGSCNGRH